jgi:hypothetical protein
MKTVLVLALIAAACVCSDANPGTGRPRLRESRNGRPFFYAGGEPAHTSTPGQWSQADTQRYYYEYKRQFEKDKWDKICRMMVMSQSEREVIGYLQGKRKQKQPFTPKEIMTVRFLLCQILELGRSVGGDVIRQSLISTAYLDFDNIWSPYPHPVIQNTFNLMINLAYGI